jgi:hypothetical protein
MTDLRGACAAPLIIPRYDVEAIWRTATLRVKDIHAREDASPLPHPPPLRPSFWFGARPKVGEVKTAVTEVGAHARDRFARTGLSSDI